MNNHMKTLHADSKRTGIKTVCGVMKFDYSNAIHVIRNFAPTNTVKEITREEYPTTGGGTALNDAIITGIKKMENAVGKKKDVDVTITIFTDGYENSSKNNAQAAAEHIERAKAKGWTIAFMGQGNASNYAGKLKIEASNVLSYVNTVNAMTAYSSARSAKSDLLMQGVKSNVGFFVKQ